jgi:hypothetical protein
MAQSRIYPAARPFRAWNFLHALPLISASTMRARQCAWGAKTLPSPIASKGDYAVSIGTIILIILIIALLGGFSGIGGGPFYGTGYYGGGGLGLVVVILLILILLGKI